MHRLFFIILIIFIACSNGQIKQKTSFQNVIVNDILINGTHEADFISLSEYTIKQKKIFRKFLNGTIKNEHWFDSIYGRLQHSESLKYDSHMGISRIEFDTLIAMLYHPNLLSENGQIKIGNDGKTIHFKGDGKLSILDSLVIDLNDSSAMFGNVHLFITDTSQVHKIAVPDNDYLISALIYRESHSTLEFLTSTVPNLYRLCIAKLGKSGKTFIDLKGREYKDSLPLDMHVRLIIQ